MSKTGILFSLKQFLIGHLQQRQYTDTVFVVENIVDNMLKTF